MNCNAHFFMQEVSQQKFEMDSSDSPFHIALTDAGLCQVLNGNTMMSTFKHTIRIEELWTAFDKRNAVEPMNIIGSGKMYQKTFWLDIGDR